MKKHLKSLLIAVVSVCVVCVVSAVLAAPAAVTQSTAEVNKNLPPYNFKEKINDAVSDLTKIDIPAIILNLNEVITNSPFATNGTITLLTGSVTATGTVTLVKQTVSLSDTNGVTADCVTNVTGTVSINVIGGSAVMTNLTFTPQQGR